eukprot:gene15405-biopygen11231
MVPAVETKHAKGRRSRSLFLVQQEPVPRAAGACPSCSRSLSLVQQEPVPRAAGAQPAQPGSGCWRASPFGASVGRPRAGG